MYECDFSFVYHFVCLLMCFFRSLQMGLVVSFIALKIRFFYFLLDFSLNINTKRTRKFLQAFEHVVLILLVCHNLLLPLPVVCYCAENVFSSFVRLLCGFDTFHSSRSLMLTLLMPIHCMAKIVWLIWIPFFLFGFDSDMQKSKMDVSKLRRININMIALTAAQIQCPPMR